MDVFEAIYGRRSIRSYVQRPVERDLIETVILDAAQAPPPVSGAVPWTFNIVLGIERIAALGVKAMNHAKAHHRADEPGWSWLDRSGFKIFWDAPVLVVISGPIEDCCRAGQNLMLSAHARGLGTLPWVPRGNSGGAAEEATADYLDHLIGQAVPRPDLAWRGGRNETHGTLRPGIPLLTRATSRFKSVSKRSFDPAQAIAGQIIAAPQSRSGHGPTLSP
jgi:hypothetical protein